MCKLHLFVSLWFSNTKIRINRLTHFYRTLPRKAETEPSCPTNHPREADARKQMHGAGKRVCEADKRVRHDFLRHSRTFFHELQRISLWVPAHLGQHINEFPTWWETFPNTMENIFQHVGKYFPTCWEFVYTHICVARDRQRNGVLS